MQSIQDYQKAFETYLKQFEIVKEPRSLYHPVNYILALGGKRLRPVLTLMTSEIFGADYRKALPAALSIEVFHNFSLVQKWRESLLQRVIDCNKERNLPQR